MPTVGERIRHVRTQVMRWSLRQMERECRRYGLDLNYKDISRIERGERKIDFEREAPILAKVLGLTPNDLVGWRDDE